MVIDTEDAAGTALLLAAAPVGKGRLIDAVGVLPALAAVPPGALTGTAAATLVELADPLDPQAVLTRLRAAVAAPGPLSLYIAGQLHLDHRQRLPHLALARTSPATLRYTALPWHWIAGELKLRRPGTTTVVLDLVADDPTWQQLATDRGLLALCHGVRVYGRVVPPPGRRTIASPDYLKACAAIWRSGARPPLAALHEQAAAQAGAQSGTHATLVFAAGFPPAPVPSARQESATDRPAADTDPLPSILAAAASGRHGEAAAAAAAWEQHAHRTYGSGSPQAVHWLEVRADLARLAGDPAASCRLWMVAAEARLARQQTRDDRQVEGAVDRAHHQWERLRDPDTARALAPALIALRRRVPGRQRGALQVLQRRLERWHDAGEGVMR
ncbi:hypothetical protein [Streptomyces sp. CB03238]|uniref:hypothetical protein n=1 Tax=Streptomyces sp. CB03238 TaxID=1907777 RepID=UPI000A0FDDFB|nr:hypothetical protein [Streptomyces sp. CB03238]ORT57006.1 hypothetical protein BKD26_25575 [Streptomyces sp. CB03238]